MAQPGQPVNTRVDSGQPLPGAPEEPAGFGLLLPRIIAPPPGPRSREQIALLTRTEGPAISTTANGDLPIFWSSAAGANVLDLDGNLYVDTTSAFGVAGIGHRHPAVAAAVQQQARRLLHGMGDFLPFAPRAELADRLTRLAPMQPAKVLFGLSGADAVELALKVAYRATGRPGVIAFDAAFHGQSYGVLPLAGRAPFREPFAAQLGRHILRAPYPYPYRFAGSPEACTAASLDAVAALLAGPPPAAGPVGAVLIEPMAGREGEIVPPPDFLPGLRRLCDARGVLLIVDEIYTGLGRTGSLWAIDQVGVVPDLLCTGKALGGGLPISAVLGRADLMDAWRPQSVEAPHSSTFLCHPLGAAAALAVLDVLEREGMAARATATGARLLEHLETLQGSHPGIGEVRGQGAALGVELVRDANTKEPAPEIVGALIQGGLERGIIFLPGGMHGNVLSLAPCFIMSEDQIGAAVNAIDEVLRADGQ